MEESHSSKSIISWRGHVMVLAVMATFYGALLYFGITYVRAPVSADAKGPPMFMPVVSTTGEQRGGMAEANSPQSEAQGKTQDQEQMPPRRWAFPPIDLMPSAPGWTAAVTDLTPITNAEPDPSEAQAPPEEQAADESDLLRPKLQMVGWFRPVYGRDQCGRLSADHLLILDLLINPEGQPAAIKMAQSSGSSKLDQTALHAAGFWRFAPPVWQSRPMEVSARVSLRFNC